MKQKLLKDHEIGFFALGGLGEVGKNTYVFEIEKDIFIVDAGIMFPDDSLLGVDYVIPDYTYLIENQERIRGLFITHGHEDHIEHSLSFKTSEIPKIYARFAVDLLENKLLEYDDVALPQIVEYKAHHTFKFKGAEVSFIRLNHSIPDMFGINFKTKHGNIFYTGDFKIDYTPVGPIAEYEKLSKIASEGVLCLLSDSTNAERPGTIPSEQVIGSSIDEIFQQLKGRIIIATFASNIYRMQQIVSASILNNRKIAVVGRSMERAMEIGMNTGYIRAPKEWIIDPLEVDNYEPNEITILCTGSQGEPMAALTRIASGTHRQIKVKPNDTVIFSSSPIPGNQEGVNKTVDMLYRNEVTVIVNGPVAETHTSGHGAQDDLMLMLTLTRPKFFIPVHGEHRMLKEHGNLAINLGIKKDNILILDNGDVAALSKDYIKKVGTVKSGDVYIDGYGIGSTGAKLINERKALSEDGLLSVILSVNENKELILKPTIVSRGFIFMKTNEDLISQIQKMARLSYVQSVNRNFSLDKIKTQIETDLSEYIHGLTERKPLILTSVIEI